MKVLTKIFRAILICITSLIALLKGQEEDAGGQGHGEEEPADVGFGAWAMQVLREVPWFTKEGSDEHH